jgi:hypothetical protein
MNARDERLLVLRDRDVARVEMPWRTHGLLLRAVLFVFTALGTGALYWFLDLVDVPGPGIATGVIAIAAAELLIRKARWWWTGVEEALWICAAFALISELPRSGTPEAALVLALAAAVPGWRVRNPLFGAVAACFVVTYSEARFDLGVICALVLGALAVLALLRTWERPSTEWLFVALAVVMPIAGRVYADALWRDLTIVLYFAFAIAVLTLAIRKRHHALFVSGGIGLAIAAVGLTERIDLAVEAKLALGGVLLLVGSWLVARALRDRTRGLVATPAKLTPFDDELEVAATIAISQQTFDEKMESGGEFGGAGATGKY